MAVYKVIQDIEAEDKLVGFLTLKTFIYALIAASLAYIDIRMLIATELGPLRFVFILILLFPTFLFGILAAPLGRDQPTEVWILSHLRFFLTPHKRTWDQSGAQELVTITAPKKIEQHLTKDLSQTEVQSRLKALATTLDSRGWAVKNVAVNLSAQPDYFDRAGASSDRLISASTVAQNQPVVDVHASDDIMDEQNNPTAQKFEAMMQKADEQRKQEVVERVEEARQEAPAEPPPDYSFIDKAPAAVDEEGNTKFVGHKIITPGSDEQSESSEAASLDQTEAKFLQSIHQKAEEVHRRSAGFTPKAHHKEHKSKSRKAHEASQAPAKTQDVPQKPAENPDKPKQDQTAESAMTQPVQNAKLKELIEVGKNDKLSTLAQEANRQAYRVTQPSPNEVEIDLR